jgi:hypothetical protein
MAMNPFNSHLQDTNNHLPISALLKASAASSIRLKQVLSNKASKTAAQLQEYLSFPSLSNAF